MKPSKKTTINFAVTLLGFISSFFVYSKLLWLNINNYITYILIFFMFLELTLMFWLMRIHDMQVLNGE